MNKPNLYQLHLVADQIIKRMESVGVIPGTGLADRVSV